MNLTVVEKSILRIICYFDIMALPLTLLEIYKWLDIDVSLDIVQQSLASENLRARIASQSGFYFLIGRDFLVQQRLDRYSLADYKFKRALRIIKILSYFSGVRAIAIYSSLSFSNSNIDSDIDLFIVADSQRLWSSRFWVNSFLKFFCLRPTKRKKQDKICVSFWVTTNSLNLQSVNSDQDLLYVYGTGQFMFVYDQTDITSRFFQENLWLNQTMPNWFAYDVNYRKRINLVKIIKSFLLEGILFLVPEKYYKKIQLFILPPRLQAMKNLDTRVIINDQMIKLHDHDRRQAVRQAFELKINQLFCDGE